MGGEHRGALTVPTFMPAHDALGSKAMGVALIAGGLILWRFIRGDIQLRPALSLAVPGFAGVYGGFQLSQRVPGRLLVFVLGALLVAVAAWVAYASTLSGKVQRHQGQLSRSTEHPLWIVCVSGAVLGFAAGFLGIAGGFLVVPALMVLGELSITEAAASALLPITVFASWIGRQYGFAGAANAAFALTMLPPGLLAGGSGIWIGRHVSATVSQRVFSVFLLALAAYMMLKP